MDGSSQRDLSLVSMGRAAEILRGTKGRVLEVWENRVRVHIDAASEKAPSVLRDCIPDFLDQLTESFARAHENGPDRIATDTSREHGQQRASLAGYSIAQIVDEYRLLRQTIFEVLDAKGCGDRDVRDLVLDSIDAAVDEACNQFMQARRHEIEQAGQERARVAREQSDLRERANRSELKYRAIVASLHEGVVVHSATDGSLIDFNASAERILGLSREELHGRKSTDVRWGAIRSDGSPLPGEEHPAMVSLRTGLSVRDVEMGINKTDGRLTWISVSSQPIFEEGAAKPFASVASFRDITERKRIEAELKEAKEAAESASRLKTAFLANMSHEIRTPLTAILGFTDLFKCDSPTAAERSEYLEIIERNGRSLMRLIDDILDLSKVEAGRLEVELLQFSLPGLLEEMMALFGEKAKDKGIRLRLENRDSIPERIISDPTRLRQILINLIGNAVKFTEQGEVTVNVKVVERPEVPHASLSIIVHDTGPGLTEEQKARLFEPFMQADNSTTRRFGGTGLGLALSKRLATALGGDLTIANCTPGGGCAFVLTFTPIIVQASTARAAAGVETAPAFSRVSKSNLLLQGLRILVVEDTEDSFFLVKRHLDSRGAAVERASNGKEGIEKAFSGNPDIVLMDIQMPVLDGYEATMELRRGGFAKPIIALTAHAMKKEREKSLEAGCDAHLTKPLNPSELVGTVAHFTGRV